MEENKTIIVPWDFTPLAEFAMQHAIKLAGILSIPVTLVHIVKKDSEIDPAKKKLEKETQRIFNEHKVTPQVVVREGSIFNTISEVAEETNAILVIMGTHGIRGMQKFLGSWALKVIASSKVPFIIVQESPQNDRFEKVVLPINFKRENREAMPWVNFLNTLFKVKIHILKDASSDSKFKKNIESNIYFATKYFESKGIQYEVAKAEGKKEFARETTEYAHSIGADIILIMTTRDIGIADYVLGANEQYIIANSFKIPVMCSNPRPPKNLGSFSASGG